LVSIAQVILLGDVAAILAFGSVAFLGIIGSLVLDAKKARQHVAAWRAFTAATSNVPFLAIIRGRQHLSVSEIGPWLSACLWSRLRLMTCFPARACSTVSGSRFASAGAEFQQLGFQALAQRERAG
jgi:hypothetical protein